MSQEYSRREFLKIVTASAAEISLFTPSFSDILKNPSAVVNEAQQVDTQLYYNEDGTLAYSPQLRAMIRTETGEKVGDVIFPVDQPQFYVVDSRGGTCSGPKPFWQTRSGFNPEAVTSPNLDFIAHGVNYHSRYEGCFAPHGVNNVNGFMISTPGGFFDVKDEYYTPSSAILRMPTRIENNGDVYSEGRHNGLVLSFRNREYEVVGDYLTEGVAARKVVPIDCGIYAWCKINEAEWRAIQ